MTTLEHLNEWLCREFPHTDESAWVRLRTRMMAVYETDPEFYGNQSWWNCYNVARDPD